MKLFYKSIFYIAADLLSVLPMAITYRKQMESQLLQQVWRQKIRILIDLIRVSRLEAYACGKSEFSDTIKVWDLVIMLYRIVHFIDFMLLSFLVCDVSYRRNNLPSDMVVQLSLFIFKDIRIKCEVFVIFRFFCISLGIWVRHLGNGVFLG